MSARVSLATINGQPLPGRRMGPGDGPALFDRSVDNARRAAHWLADRHGIAVLSLSVNRLGATLTVPADPRLWRIFRDQCAWQQRRQVGALTVYTWFAVIFGTRIEWEETQCR